MLFADLLLSLHLVTFLMFFILVHVTFFNSRCMLEQKEKHFGRLATFWFGTFAMRFSATGCVVRHENTRK